MNSPMLKPPALYPRLSVAYQVLLDANSPVTDRCPPTIVFVGEKSAPLLSW